jgi:hypothetical protein
MVSSEEKNVIGGMDASKASKQASKQSKQDFIGLTGAFSVTLGTDTH